jgi:hypothetical protein
MAEEAIDNEFADAEQSPEVYTVRLPEEGVRHVIGALGVMSGFSMNEKYEKTMTAVRYQYGATSDNSEVGE